MNLIEKLADLVGFHRSYVDCFKNHVSANEQARYSLLQAMGYDLTSDETITKSITQLEQAPWTKILPATHVAKLEQAHHHILVSLPIASASTLTWCITTEKGETTEQLINIAQLTDVEQTSINNTTFVKYQLPLPSLEQGYHQLTITYDDNTDHCHLIYAPKTCYSPQEASRQKMWGYAAQLYSLNSDKNWGLGDFGDLQTLVTAAAKQQASVIGLNPLHPLYQNNPAHRSPYSPTSRCFLNTIYISVEQIPYFAQCLSVQKKLKEQSFKDKVAFAKSCKLIDYPAVANVKFEVIELLYEEFLNKNSAQPNNAIEKEFLTFKEQGGDDLARLATFDAIYEHIRKDDPNAYGWSAWPTEFQSPSSPTVVEFSAKKQQRIDYFIYLQWLAHRQLSSVAATAKQDGMPIGLYLDLAVGCDGSGVDVWSDQSMYVSGAAVGAPPDAMNVLGQDWGLTPINPVALQQQGFMPLVKALRSNMQYAGALRIDHILGLMRQYWVAPGMKADQGIYITFPFEQILRIIALESRRNDCVVIGEDLGTVPDGFSEIMANAGLLSYKVLFFETWESGLFKRPELYPEQSMVTVSTHDLPTLSGWWTGRDLQWRQQLHLYPNEKMGQDERNLRVEQRQSLIAALEDLQTIDKNDAPNQSPATMNRALTLAVQQFLAQANSHIQLIPLEDALEVHEQVNIPGTIDEHANWLQKLPITLEQWQQTESLCELAEVMQHARPKN